jgi:hypothetical protein
LKKLLSILFLLFFFHGFSQSGLESFLKPSDSLNKKRLKTVVISESAIAAATLVGLSSIWYSDYSKTNFRLCNDNDQWLQMDKVGHVYSSYQLGRFGYDALNWAGVRKKDKLLYGATLGFAFLTAVEVFDGYSSEWGFSLGDVAANAGGTVLFVSQELLWNEQRIIPKFSFHTTPYASARPNVLGSNLPEQILKDYNGQTYWLSFNLHSFFKGSKIPKWANVAIGYGAEGLVTGKDELVNTIFFPQQERIRQFYLSLDVDLTKIPTKSPILKTVFSIFNTIKIPAPTFEVSGSQGVKFKYLYF